MEAEGEWVEFGALGAPCPKCGGRSYLNRDFDTFFCPRCREWCEVKCNDPDCAFCAPRPDRPSERLASIALAGARGP